MSTDKKMRELTCLGCLLVVNSLLYAKVLFNGALLAGGDVNYQYSIWKQFFVDWVNKGVFPFWNPYVFCGTPFLHDMQTATLYPPDLLHFVLPIPWSFGFSAFLHTLFAGCVFFYLAGEWIEQYVARLFSALLFMISGYIVTRMFVGEPTVTQAYSWIPAFFLTGIRVYEAPTLRRVGFFALVCALIFLAGHPHLPFLIAHAFVAYLVVLTVRPYFVDRWGLLPHPNPPPPGGRENNTLKRELQTAPSPLAGEGWGGGEDSRQPFQKEWRGILRGVLALLLGGVLALLAVAPQAGPFFEFASYSATRSGGATYAFAAEGSLSPMLMILQLFPFFFGDPPGKSFWISTIPYMEISAYLGVFGLFFIFVALLLPRKPYTFLWLGLAGVAFILAMGEFTPLHKVFYYLVPGWDHFRNPGRSLLVYTFAGCLLAGYGLESLLNLREEEWTRYMGRLTAVFLIILVIISFSACLVQRMEGQILDAFARVGTIEMKIATGGLSGELKPVQFQSRFDWMIHSLWVASLYAALFMALLGLYTWKRHWKEKLIWGFVVICAVDLLIFGQRFLQARSEEEWKAEYYPDSKPLRAIQEGGYGGRLLITDLGLDWRYRPEHPELFPDGPMRYGIQSVRGYSPSILKHFSEFINLMQGRPAEALPGGLLFLDEPTRMDPLALQVMGVRTVLTTQPLPAPFVPKERFPSNIFLYEYQKGLPRCFRAHPAANRWGLEPVDHAETSTMVAEIHPNRIEVETQGPGEELLVFADAWFPGWRAWVNGEEKSIEHAFHAFQAVPVPAGKSQVIFEFRPNHWNLYLTLSAAGLLLILIFMCIRTSPVTTDLSPTSQ